ncbi:nucleotidyltransferase domain-containing protein [Streptosporangium sandarakinum]|uniref:nucleotidyltransferase domain-containing protein n=1 Tax=Streptosporangium sandarakinum TaxID=1260955 RepID=UPI0033AE1987
MDDTELEELAGRMAEVPGVVAVVLGGSRARGTHRPDSDYDLGLYYRGELDVTALRALAVREAGERAELTAPGSWGPWVNGGGWLINEKGMVASAGRLPAAPEGFAVRAERLLGRVGEPAERIAETVTEAAALMGEVRAAVGR